MYLSKITDIIRHGLTRIYIDLIGVNPCKSVSEKTCVYSTIILILLLFTSISCAYDEEAGLEEGESYNVEFEEGYNYYQWKDPEHPNWYDPIIKLVIKIVGFFKNDVEGTMTHEIEKEVWDGSAYQPSGDKSTFSWDLNHDANQTESITTEIDPVEEYFKDDRDRIDDFKSVDDDLEYPDILNVSTTINYDGEELDSSDYGYTTLTDDDLTKIEGSVGRDDYGFSAEGMGGEGGIGDVYGHIGTGSGKSQGNSNTFRYLFYALIPLLFILSIINMLTRVITK